MTALMIRSGLVVLFLAALPASVSAEDVQFDSDAVLLYSSLPLDVSLRGFTTHFAATHLAQSLQLANALRSPPQGLVGCTTCPTRMTPAHLPIRSVQAPTLFSIISACDTHGADDAATPTVTARVGGTRVGTTARRVSIPGAWLEPPRTMVHLVAAEWGEEAKTG